MSKTRAGSAKGAVFSTATAVNLVAGGEDYAENDIVAVNVPGALFKPNITVDSVDGDGTILTASLLSGGRFPTDETGTHTTTKVTGVGTGATFTLTKTTRGT